MRSDFIGPEPGVYNYGSVFNLTRTFWGFDVRSRKLLNDFGATKWYAELVNFVVFQVSRYIPVLIRLVTVTGSRWHART